MSEKANEATKDVCGLTRVVSASLERAALRRREDTGLTSGWKLVLTCDQGSGGILPVPITATETRYRGEGLFLGWDQARLAEVYRVLTAPTDDKPDLELQQLG